MGDLAGTGGSVLLVAHTRLSLGYVLEHYRLLRGSAGLSFALTRAPDEHAAGVGQMMQAAGLPRLPYCAAVRRAWDLALFGTHGSEIFFTGAATRVHIQHGLGVGKLVDGQDFTYGPKWALGGQTKARRDAGGQLRGAPTGGGRMPAPGRPWSAASG